MIHRTVIPVLWLWLACVIIGAALAGSAKADPAEDFATAYAADVCIVLDDHPTIPGLTGVLQAVQETGGLTARQAGQAVALSVINVCPRHIPLLRRYVAMYAPRASGALA
ncbi:hypothetical protein MSP7336_01833 [Mycobacterium shimoidei]|uniref:DUF732 domain-containing protein n=1 Tax=Mycobacterium shimoidei TaxID=29313 RepID=A0A375YXH3_MYCSH|nr:hypothetical protein [Mycobacterium shimoidei]SRX93594.1 hypothetical protein MSP7336_01833 [Mycobacterium shimoidei]